MKPTLHLHARRSLLSGALVGLGLGLAQPSPLQARSFELRAVTVGQATQYRRSDLTIDAPRRFDQALSLRAFDLNDDGTGDLNVHLAMRYATDLALDSSLRQEPALLTQQNAIALDLASVQWRPWPALTITAGRQWSWGALGMGDFDGARLLWRHASGQLRPTVDLWAGRDVQAWRGGWSPDTWDVQGLPLIQEAGQSWLVGSRLALDGPDDLRLEASYQRRWSTDLLAPSGQRQALALADERVAGALSLHPTPSLHVHAHGAYHLALQSLTVARLELAWRLPWAQATATLGAMRRRPWFDLSSIFNLFDPQPSDDLMATLALPVDAHQTIYQLRLWRRVFHAQASGLWGLSDSAWDASASGVAIAHQTRQRLGRTWFDWTSTLSLQLGQPGSGGDQFLLDTSARAPAFVQGLFFHARLLGLAAWHDHHRYDGPEYTGTALIGLDYPVLGQGVLSAALEQRVSVHAPTTTIAYMTLTLEVWP